jgi:hypothetical protein
LEQRHQQAQSNRRRPKKSNLRRLRRNPGRVDREHHFNLLPPNRIVAIAIDNASAEGRGGGGAAAAPEPPACALMINGMFALKALRRGRRSRPNAKVVVRAT